MSEPLLGIHHVTAFCREPQQTIDFYTQVLGLRLIKLTVNYDSPDTYHLYFGDAVGTPGTLYTHFPLPRARRRAPRAGQVIAAAYRVSRDAAAFWRERLTVAGVTVDEIDRFGEQRWSFQDPDGLTIELLPVTDHGPFEPWTGPEIDAGAALGPMAGATFAVADPERTAAVLAEVLGLILGERNGAMHRLRFVHPGTARTSAAGSTVIDLVPPPTRDERGGRFGPGTVHHIAFRVADESSQVKWRDHLVNAGFDVTDVRDRMYFKSIYFREPGGVIIELATDGPGFTVDESVENLGRGLMLPPWLAPRRDELRATLPEVNIAGAGRA